MAPRRKTPFSGKAKKEQLKEKKVKHQMKNLSGTRSNVLLLKKIGDEDSEEEELNKVVKLNEQPTTSSSKNKDRNVNRYALHFYKEAKAEIESRKLAAQNSVVMVGEEDLEIDYKEYFPMSLSIPKRPPWNFDMSREELNAREHRYFTEFVDKIEKEFGVKNLSYFELNLETWRQLWRVLEMSDIVLIVVDIRFAGLMFPPSIYKHVVEDLKKNMILVLNKIDLAPPDLVVAWKHYFLDQYPTLKIVTFTSYPSYNLRNENNSKSGLQFRRKKGKPSMSAEGAQKLYEACKEITDGQVNITSWAEKIKEEMNLVDDDDNDTPLNITTEAVDTGYHEHIRYHKGTLTIGCIGQPNVGKSSLMNAIMGKKVVSVSRTPGHTKHFQTIYLTENVILCDCPGLVFPSKTPRTLQILNGAFPIAQVREPYTAVRYLAERLNLPEILRIQHPENDDTWSPIDICDGWAKKRGFFTAKTCRPDTYRAANNLLRLSLDGKICLCLRPPGYLANKTHWLNHPEVAEVTWIQAKFKEEKNIMERQDESENSFSDDEEKVVTDNEKDGNESSDESDSGPVVVNRFAVLQGGID